MSSNRSYFSNFLAAFRAHQSVFQPGPASKPVPTRVASQPRAVPCRSFSTSPHRSGSVSPPRSDDNLSSSPFDHLSDSEWNPPIDFSRLVSSKTTPKVLLRNNSPGSSPVSSALPPVVPSAKPTPASLHPHIQAPLSPPFQSPAVPVKRSLHFPVQPNTDPAVHPRPNQATTSVRYQVTQQAVFPPTSTNHRHRRGSDSSNEGFRDAVPDKWYIGGTNAAGDESFYRLGVIKRPRSLDRLSLDQMSV